jgi:hypothetical protein
MLEPTEVGLEYDSRRATFIHPWIASAIRERAHQSNVNGVRRTDGEEQVESRERSERGGYMYVERLQELILLHQVRQTRFLIAPPTLVVVQREPELATVEPAASVVLVPRGPASPTIPSKPVANKIAPSVPTLKGKTVVEPRES